MPLTLAQLTTAFPAPLREDLLAALQAGEPAPGELGFLEQGVVRVLEDERVVGLLEAPQVLALGGALTGVPSPRYQALPGAVLRRWPASSLSSLRARGPELEQALLAPVLHAWREAEASAHAEEARRGRGYFLEPNARILPGPFEAADFTMSAFVMETDATALAELLPPGVRSLPGTRGHYLLTFNDFPSMVATHRQGRGETVAYREVAIFLPCLGPALRPGLFMPALFPDSPLAVAMGREQYGFPKRLGKVGLGKRFCALATADELQAGVTWKKTAPCAPAEAVSAVVKALLGTSLLSLGAGWTAGLLNERGAEGTVPLRMRKQILAPHALVEPRYDVDSLVEVPFHVSGARNTELLEGCEAEPFGPDLSWSRGARCVTGARLLTSFRFGEGRVLTDYLPVTGDKGRDKSSSVGTAARALRNWMGTR